MQALILAGGKGTRLRPLTVYTPKPIVPICNRPFLLYQIEMLKRAGIKDIILSLSYQPQKIEQLLGDGSDFGVRLRYLVEPQPMGTAGAYKFAKEFIRESTVVFNGDVLTDLDLQTVIDEHNNRQATATIVLTPVQNPSAYGLVETETDGRILRFLEKPKMHEITCNTINAGTYILEPKVMEHIPDNEYFMFEYGVFPSLLEKKEEFFSHIPDNAYWLDIGTPARYLQANQDLLDNKVSRFTIEKRLGNFNSVDNAYIDDQSMVADNCTIKSGVQIINSVLGEGCYVEEKSLIENSVILPNTRIGANANLSSCVIGRGCHIGRNALISSNVTLGDKSSLTDFTIIGG